MTEHLCTVADVERVLGAPFADTAYHCHEVSLELVRSDLFEDARVARGWCRGITSQHSWVVVGDDCYDPQAQIVDATLWSYQQTTPDVWHGLASDGLHRPHGLGTIWTRSCPEPPSDPVIELPAEVQQRLSPAARRFLEVAGPDGLDRNGWAVLAHSPVGEWPAREIFEAMLDTPGLGVLIPIDVVGMVTDRNPGGLYLRTEP